MLGLHAVSFGFLTTVLLVTNGPALAGATKRAIDDYEFYPGVGYYMHFLSDNSNWTEAYETCQVTYGGQMAVPNSEAEAEIYKALIATADPTYQSAIFVGFHDRFVNGEYETIHGVSVDDSGYPVWAPDSPNTIPQLRCGGFAKEGGLQNYNCAYQGKAITICELPLWADYELVPGHGYYTLHVEAKSWERAWKTCRDEDSHLAVINSVEEYNALQEIFSRHPVFPGADSDLHAYVGIHAKFSQDRYYTVHGTSLANAGYSTWESGQPGVGDNSSFTSVALTRNGHLTLRPSTDWLAFFCEHQL